MNWRVFTLPHGFARGNYFPGTIAESIDVESIINCALLATNEYFSLFKGRDQTLDIEHFNEFSSDSCMTEVTEDLIDTVTTVYDIFNDSNVLRREICDQIAPCYDKLKELFYTSSIFQGVFKGSSDVESFNTYIIWIDSTNFVLLEFEERRSTDGLLDAFPWIKEYSLLGI